jgi:predicted phosphodiesterase
MKTVLIGDIHGRDSWKHIVNNEQDADRFVFVGDYFDSFEIPGLIQYQNFQDIIAFKESTDKEVILLIGNHDYHYFPEIGENGTSGYQPRMAPTIQHLINTNRNHLQMAYQFDDVLVTHAGVSSEWADDVLGEWKVETLSDQINELFKYQPHKIEFRQYKQVGDKVYGVGGYGDETFQGPIWIRPRSLMKANYDTLRTQVIQIVGHTHFKKIDIDGNSTGKRYYFVDTLPNQYLIWQDGEFSLGLLK